MSQTMADVGEYVAYEFAEQVACAIAQAPPLSIEQVDRLTVLFAEPALTSIKMNMPRPAKQNVRNSSFVCQF